MTHDFFNISHPTNRVWPGSPNYVQPTIEESFADGALTGYTWPARWDHQPGGPIVYGPGRNGECKALADHQKRCYKAWMEGWDVGFLKQYPDPRSRPKWYRPSEKEVFSFPCSKIA